MIAPFNDISQDLLAPNLVPKLSGLLGESPFLIKQAIDLVILNLTDAAYQTVSTSTGAHALVQVLKPDGSDSEFQSTINFLFDSGSISEVVLIGEKLLAIVLGSNTGQVVKSIAKTTGVSDLSASALLHLASPLILASFSKLPSVGKLTS